MQLGLIPELDEAPRFLPSPLQADGQTVETGAPVTAATALGETLMTARGDGSVRIFGADPALR
ncbi:hypothetical protein EKE94_17920 [Mesobaculum littorinae]|uniref:Uncharacterized protein n=1 Tax=Mesobaculum littorinae TaxID=2486419 RepID=A0A438AD23_9RHOB|nr:hypothetical protein [Mesobaculum littorinae]RVV96601.1 hypothetical protein EKE94_17920 [Mesobaculum littorinae]